jgi:Leucine-rich repeat (LRR) protein
MTMDYDGLNGTIPTEFGLMKSLTQLSLGGNSLQGTIPSQLGLLTQLNLTFSLKMNQLSGTIPTELGRLTSLSEFKLHNNQLTGQIPSELGQFTGVEHISFANNSLSGTIPSQMTSLTSSLHTIRFENNVMLSGIIPDVLCHFNATCIGSGFNPCEEPYGLGFTCSSLICGCGCDLCVP